MPSLRQLGYRTRCAQPSPLLAMAERAQLRPRPLCRAFPREGHWIMRCPVCGGEDGAYIEPGMVTWTTLCSRGEYSILEMHALLVAGVAA
jgi:hypothetical protein